MDSINLDEEERIIRDLGPILEEGEEEEEEEEGVFKANAMNEVDAGRDRATPASVRHDDDEPDASRPLVFIHNEDVLKRKSLRPPPPSPSPSE